MKDTQRMTHCHPLCLLVHRSSPRVPSSVWILPVLLSRTRELGTSATIVSAVMLVVMPIARMHMVASPMRAWRSHDDVTFDTHGFATGSIIIIGDTMNYPPDQPDAESYCRACRYCPEFHLETSLEFVPSLRIGYQSKRERGCEYQGK